MTSGLLALTVVLTALSFPPFDQGYLAFVALVPLLLATGKGPGGRDLLLGWAAGWAASTAVVWWVVNTITHYGGIAWTLAVPILLLMTWAMGFFWALFCLARGRILRRWPRAPDYLISPAIWVALEYARAHLPEIGFPWALLGYTQYLNLPLIQTADLFGVWSVSFLVMAVNCGVACVVRRVDASGRRVGLVQKAAALLCCAALLAGSWLYGRDRIAGEEGAATLKVAVIQGNIEQDVKWNPAYKKQTMDIYADLTREAAGGKLDLVVWPETATPFFFHSDLPYRRLLSSLAVETATPILFGSPGRHEGEAGMTLSNRAYLIDAGGVLRGWYDKLHLVPFGEYVPWRGALFFVDKLVKAVGEFSPGREAVVLEIPAGKFGTLICYEIIFPDLARRFVLGGATFLVNITNDAWFGRTAASRQHFSTLVFRAVENRRPLARAANTGISGFVDAKGRILEASDLFVRGRFVAALRPSTELTAYTLMGDLFPRFCALAAGLLLAVAIMTGGRRKKHRFDLSDVT